MNVISASFKPNAPLAHSTLSDYVVTEPFTEYMSQLGSFSIEGKISNAYHETTGCYWNLSLAQLDSQWATEFKDLKIVALLHTFWL